jgi:hypothetical protein
MPFMAFFFIRANSCNPPLLRGRLWQTSFVAIKTFFPKPLAGKAFTPIFAAPNLYWSDYPAAMLDSNGQTQLLIKITKSNEQLRNDGDFHPCAQR